MGKTAMLFHELYGGTYRIVAAILREALSSSLSFARLRELTAREGAGRGAEIRGALEQGRWPLLLPDGRPAIGRVPDLPPTDLEKRWLKAICQDPRVRIFLPDDFCARQELADAEPLYSPDFFACYDRYADGDPFEDPTYIKNMRLIVRALREKTDLVAVYRGKNGVFSKKFHPRSLEYSPKDDKFRLIASNMRGLPFILNAASILDVILKNSPCPEAETPRTGKKMLDMELEDDRNTLERALLHFSDLEKETRRLDESHYRVTLRYYESDETEILIRVLSFGPTLHVIGPDSFVSLIKERLSMQKKLLQG